jgi:hypothetical protein
VLQGTGLIEQPAAQRLQRWDWCRIPGTTAATVRAVSPMLLWIKRTTR